MAPAKLAALLVAAQLASAQVRVMSDDAFAAGDRVEAQFFGGPWHPATVEREVAPGRYQIEWDDMDKRDRVKMRFQLRRDRVPELKLLWFADNRTLAAKHPRGSSFASGVSYHSSRDDPDVMGVLPWGESAEGYASQGWLRVGKLQLPMRMDGIPVLRPAAAPKEPPASGLHGRNAADPAVAALSAWLEDECSATGIGGVFVGRFQKGGVSVRGIGTAVDVMKGDHVICVPQRCALNPERRESLPLPADASNGTCDDKSHAAYWMALEQAKGDASPWSAYFATMPSEADLRQFHPAYLEDLQLSEEVDIWSSLFPTLRECHAGRQTPTYEEMKLQYVRLITRKFPSVGMVPLADMANTGPRSECNLAQVLNKQGDFCLSANRDLWAGEELMVDYGVSQHSPLEMLLLGGFALSPEHHSQIGSDQCLGLRGLGQRLPANASSALRSFAHFAGGFCAGGADEADEAPSAKPQWTECAFQCTLSAVTPLILILILIRRPRPRPASSEACAGPRRPRHVASE